MLTASEIEGFMRLIGSIVISCGLFGMIVFFGWASLSRFTEYFRVIRCYEMQKKEALKAYSEFSSQPTRFWWLSTKGFLHRSEHSKSA